MKSLNLWRLYKLSNKQINKYCFNASLITTKSRHYATDANIVKSPYPTVVLPRVPLQKYMWEKTENWPDKVAFECGLTGRKYTYSEIRKLTRRLAGSLLEMGLRPGDKVSLVLPNMPEYPIAFLGVIEAGMIASPINPRYTPDEICHQLKVAESKLIFAHPETVPNVLKAIEKVNKDIKVICVDDGLSPVVQGIQPFNSLLKEGSERNPTLLEVDNMFIDLDQTCLLPFSSGTTGLPKGVCLTHFSVASNLIQIEQSTPNLPATGEHQDVLPAVLPFFHIYGGVVIMLHGMRMGCKIITLPKFEPKSFLNVLDKKKNIVLYAVPPIIIFLGNHPDVKGSHLDGLRTTVSGAAPCGPSDIEKILKKKKHNIIQAYGLTEASPVLTYSPTECENKATIGFPLSNTMLKVVDWNTGESLPIGETGELCFKGPQVMKGYHNNPEATANTIKDGWLHTGDIGFANKDNFIFIKDRIKELIKVKGFQVPPAELEELLRTHPDVCEAGVVGVPDEKCGELPVAFVVPKAQTAPKPDDIKKFIADKVSKFKQLSAVYVVDSIPKNPSGKILRRELKGIALSTIK